MSRLLPILGTILCLAICGCDPIVRIRYERVAIAQKIAGAQSNPTAATPAVLRVYRVASIENETDKKFTFQSKRATACPDGDGTIHLLHVKKSSGTVYSDQSLEFDINPKSTKSTSVPLAFYCSYPGSSPDSGTAIETQVLMGYDAKGVAVLPTNDPPVPEETFTLP